MNVVDTLCDDLAKFKLVFQVTSVLVFRKHVNIVIADYVRGKLPITVAVAYAIALRLENSSENFSIDACDTIMDAHILCRTLGKFLEKFLYFVHVFFLLVRGAFYHGFPSMSSVFLKKVDGAVIFPHHPAHLERIDVICSLSPWHTTDILLPLHRHPPQLPPHRVCRM